MSDVDPKWHAGALEVALATRFCAPEFAFLPQARNCTGYGRQPRTADALALGLYPSRGLHLHGFEIKCARSDWLKEKRDPEKAEAFQQYCDFWWIVVSDPKIIQAGELPLNWGLMAPRGKTLAVAKEPTINEKAKCIDREFLAGLLRKASEVVVDDEKVKAAVRKASAEAFEQGKQHRQYEVDHAKRELKDARDSIAEFERLSGIRIGNWCGGDIGRYVRIAQGRDWAFFRKQLDQARLQLLNIVNDLEAASNGSRSGEMTDWII
jgi:hypothetical protein